MEASFDSDYPSRVISTLAEAPRLMALNQQALMMQALAMQCTWACMCAALRHAWLKGAMPPPPDPTKYLPPWLVWQNGTEQLG